MSICLTCKSCNRSMHTASGFCPPQMGSLLAYSHAQCWECHEKGIPDSGKSDPVAVTEIKDEKVVPTFQDMPVCQMDALMTDLAKMVDDAETRAAKGDLSDIDCSFCGVKLPHFPGKSCSNGHSANYMSQFLERLRRRMASPDKKVNLNDCIDAAIWAEEFCRQFHDQNRQIGFDDALAWFANAIMAGMDTQERRIGKKLEEVKSLLREIDSELYFDPKDNPGVTCTTCDANMNIPKHYERCPVLRIHQLLETL